MLKAKPKTHKKEKKCGNPFHIDEYTRPEKVALRVMWHHNHN
jgi:hypothetical protein